MRTRSTQAGFTLIELLIVVAIIGILAAILIPNMVAARSRSQRAACLTNMHNIGTGLELYFVDNARYPDAGTWAADLIAGKYIQAVPREPVNQAAYNYATNASGTTFVLWDYLDIHAVSGTTGYIVYRPESGLQIGVASVPTP